MPINTMIHYIKKATCLIIFSAFVLFVNAQRLSRDLEMGLLTNQVGYLPFSSKTCLLKGNEQKHFEVIEITSGKTVLTGTLQPHDGDFGTYAVGDFSSVVKEGH